MGCSSTPNKMIILRYHEVFFRLAAPTAMPAHLGAYSLEKTSWYHNIIILLGVEEHPKYCWDFILWNDFNIVTFCNLYLPIYVVPIPNTYLVFVRSLSEYLLVKHFFFHQLISLSVIMWFKSQSSPGGKRIRLFW